MKSQIMNFTLSRSPTLNTILLTPKLFFLHCSWMLQYNVPVTSPRAWLKRGRLICLPTFRNYLNTLWLYFHLPCLHLRLVIFLSALGKELFLTRIWVINWLFFSSSIFIIVSKKKKLKAFHALCTLFCEWQSLTIAYQLNPEN